MTERGETMGHGILCRISGRFVKIEKIGLVPEGDRSNFHYLAEVEGPEIKGQLRGIDYSVTVDGVVNVNILEVLTTEGGDKIFIERSGRSIPGGTEGEVLLRGEGKARTAFPELAWINQVPLTWEAHLRRDSVEYTAVMYGEKPA
jgi:hypothetical protein